MAEEQEKNIIRLLAKGDEEATGILFRSYHRLLWKPVFSGRQKAVNTLRELQYAGLVEIQKQGCGKPNRIYPKSYEAVPNTDFKKSGYGTPED